MERSWPVRLVRGAGYLGLLVLLPLVAFFWPVIACFAAFFLILTRWEDELGTVGLVGLMALTVALATVGMLWWLVVLGVESLS